MPKKLPEPMPKFDDPLSPEALAAGAEYFRKNGPEGPCIPIWEADNPSAPTDAPSA